MSWFVNLLWQGTLKLLMAGWGICLGGVDDQAKVCHFWEGWCSLLGGALKNSFFKKSVIFLGEGH